MLLRYKTTQAKYICRGCVLGEGDPESLNKAWQDIEALMKLEEKTVKAAEADTSFVSIDNDLTIQEKGDGGSKEAETASKGTSATESKQMVKDNNIPNCRYYMMKSCKHGKKGEGCKFRHPKLCFKFIKRGEMKGGCSKGKECQFEHPKLCHKALESRICTNGRCKFYHITGTKFSSKDEL